MSADHGFLRDALQAAYLQYLNDFLTVEGFATYHGLTQSEADAVIRAGKRVHEERTT